MALLMQKQKSCHKKIVSKCDADSCWLSRVLWQQHVSKSSHCDVTIRVDNDELKAHWCILVSSPYFMSAYNSSKSESRSGHVSLTNTTIEAVQAVLQHLYLGADPWNDPRMRKGLPEMCKLLQLADFLELTVLKVRCGRLLARYLADLSNRPCPASGSRKCCVENTDFTARNDSSLVDFLSATERATHRSRRGASCGTALKLYCLSKTHRARLLNAAAYREIVRDFEALADTLELLDVPSDLLLKFVKDRNLRYVSSKAMFQLLLRWAEHDVTARRKEFLQLVSALPLDDVDQQYYKNRISAHPALLVSVECICQSRQNCQILNKDRDIVDRAVSGSLCPQHSLLDGLFSSSAAATVTCKGMVDVIVVGGARQSRLQFAFVIDENRWAILPTIPPFVMLHGDIVDRHDASTAGNGSVINGAEAFTVIESEILCYFEAVVEQRLFALCETLTDTPNSVSYCLWELDAADRRWLSRGRLKPHDWCLSFGRSAMHSCPILYYTAFSCARKFCFLSSEYGPDGRSWLVLTSLDVIAWANTYAEQSSVWSSGRSATASLNSAGAGNDASKTRSLLDVDNPFWDRVDLWLEEGFDVKDFKYCVLESRLYLLMYDKNTLRNDKAGYLLIYDVGQRRLLDLCGGAPFGDVVYLDAEGRVCVQRISKRFCHVYNSTKKEWSLSSQALPALSEGDVRCDFFTCIHNGSMYLFGGCTPMDSEQDPEKYFASPLKYASRTSEWQPLPPAPLEFSADAEAFAMKLPKSMLQCPQHCLHCRLLYQDKVFRGDAECLKEQGTRHAVNARPRYFGARTDAKTAEPQNHDHDSNNDTVQGITLYYDD